MYGEREVLTFKGLLRYLCFSLSLSLSLSLYVGRVCWNQSIKETEKDKGDKTKTSRMNWVEKTRMWWVLFVSSFKFVELYNRGPALGGCVFVVWSVCTCWGLFGSSTIFLLSRHEYISDELRSHFYFSLRLS